MTGRLMFKLYNPESSFQAIVLVTSVFFVIVVLIVYLILGIMSLLMALFPWAP